MVKKIPPLPSDKYFHQGQEYLRKREFTKATAEFKKALRINPQHDLSLFYLGMALDEQGKKEDAEIYFKKAIEFDPNFAAPYVFLGLNYAERWQEFYEKEGKNNQKILKKAIESYEKVLKLLPEDKEIKEFLNFLKTYEEKT